LTASRDAYPLTNKSTVESTLLNVIYYSLVFPLIATTDCYEFICNNGKTYSLPVGIAKMLDSICIKTLKYSTSGNLGSLTGVVVSLYDLRHTVEFIENQYLLTTEINGVEKFSDNIKTLCSLVSRLGYTISVKQLHTILSALVIEFNEISLYDGTVDFDRLLSTFARLSTSLVKLSVTTYAPTLSSRDRVGIYKFRNSTRDSVFHVTPKAYEEISEATRQISFIFLSFFKPTYVTNGVTGANVNAEDLVLDADQHDRLNVLRALFSFEAQPVLKAESAVIDNRQVRSYTTQVGNSLRDDSLTNTIGFGSYYNRCHIWCSKPLVLIFDGMS
jgi:hypothetical protein